LIGRRASRQIRVARRPSFVVLLTGGELRWEERRGSPEQNHQVALKQPGRTVDDPRRQGTRFSSPRPAARQRAGQRECCVPRDGDLSNTLLSPEEAIHALRERQTASAAVQQCALVGRRNWTRSRSVRACGTTGNSRARDLLLVHLLARGSLEITASRYRCSRCCPKGDKVSACAHLDTGMSHRYI
jgi:hypothetical protein